VGYLLCLLLFGGFVSGVTAMRQQGDEHSLETLPQVSVEEVFLQDGFVLKVRNLGRAEAARRSAVGFELPGEISHIAVDVGDVVRQGDLLATLDTARIEASRQEAVANLAAAEANLVQAEAELRRITTLTNSAVAAARELDEAVAEGGGLTRRREDTKARRNSGEGESVLPFSSSWLRVSFVQEAGPGSDEVWRRHSCLRWLRNGRQECLPHSLPKAHFAQPSAMAISSDVRL
jgi:multidrug efflux pump subunit AcrA (membrane-fusion protein)